MNEICENCSGEIRRIRTARTNENFCSEDCTLKYYQLMGKLIIKKEIELKKLKERVDGMKNRFVRKGEGGQ